MGKCVLAEEPIPLGAIILRFGGPDIAESDLPSISSPEEDRFLQVGIGRYLGPSGEIDDLVNHSCQPNAGVWHQGKYVYLVAIESIEAEDEISFDYSTTMAKDDWSMKCLCGKRQCREVIGNFKNLPPEVKSWYIQAGVVPEYVLSSGGFR